MILSEYIAYNLVHKQTSNYEVLDLKHIVQIIY